MNKKFYESLLQVLDKKQIKVDEPMKNHVGSLTVE